MSRHKLTNYPVTFHAYLPVEIPETEDETDDLLAEADCQYDFNGRKRYFNEISYFYNQHIVEAHCRMVEFGENCILAWADTLNYPREKLKLLFGLNDKLWEKFLSADGASLPLTLIKRFCTEVGVHPAYLQPIASDSRYSYSPNVLMAIADIARDSDATEDDRAKATKALESERDHFEGFSKLYPKETAYLMVSFAKAVYLKETGADDNLNGVFSTTAHFNDIELGLHAFGDDRKADLKRMQDLKQDQINSLKNKRIDLLENASLLFDQPEAAVAAIFERIKKIQRNDPDHFDWIDWRFTPQGTIHGTMIMPKSVSHEILHVRLSDDFEARVEMHFCRPDKTKSHFLEGMVNYVVSVAAFMKTDSQFQKMESIERDYAVWRHSDTARYWHLPAFLNYKIAETALGERPLPSRREVLGLKYQTNVCGENTPNPK